MTVHLRMDMKVAAKVLVVLAINVIMLVVVVVVVIAVDILGLDNVVCVRVEVVISVIAVVAFGCHQSISSMSFDILCIVITIMNVVTHMGVTLV